MRALLLHSRKYQIKVTGLATRPEGVTPEPLIEPEQSCSNCIVAFVCFENGDKAELVDTLAADIERMIKETKHNNLVVAPFAHLSSNLASSSLALELLNALTEKLQHHNLTRTHFGSDKELLLDIFGHPGNIRFREYR